jgi:hypothetical protein
MQTEITAINHETVKVVLSGRRRQSVRVAGGILDWMLTIGDLRDIIYGLTKRQFETLYDAIVYNPLLIEWVREGNTQKYPLNNGIVLTRRLGPGRDRTEYQSVALFIPNPDDNWPFEFEIEVAEIAIVLRAFVTPDAPENYRLRDSVRNSQFIWAIFWLRREMPNIQAAELKLTSKQILRLGLP